MNVDGVVCRPLCDRDDLAAVYRLRVAAWRSKYSELFTMDGDAWSDEHDEHALHWICLDGEQIVAAARLCIHHVATELPHLPQVRAWLPSLAPPIGSMNRLVVAESHRGRGLARTLDHVRVEAARGLEVQTLLVEAIGNRRAALVEMGFTELGLAAPETESPVTAIQRSIGIAGFVKRLE